MTSAISISPAPALMPALLFAPTPKAEKLYHPCLPVDGSIS